jgi:hypothetical protein
MLAEARDLVARGVREITLLGQNVNAYHGEGPGRATGTWPADPRGWPRSRGWSASATPPATPTTWTTT